MDIKSQTLLVCIIAGLSLTVAIFRHLISAANSSCLPPGPTGKLFSGVKSQLPSSEPWKTYRAWSKQYASKIISFRVYNKIYVVLNDTASVGALLQARANIYSDRPFLWMFNVICARGKAIFNISSLDPRHRIYRRLLQQGLGTRATRDAWQTMKSQTDFLLDGFEKDPEKWREHIRRNAAGIIMKLAFGYEVNGLDDPFVKIADETSKISGWVSTPGRWIVERFPFLRHFPSFLPGMQWKRQGLEWRDKLEYLSDIPHRWVKEQMVHGHYDESFTSRLLVGDGSSPANPEYEDIIKWCAAGLYAGAADTIVSAMISFVLLMALHPEIQSKAQSEIERAFPDYTWVKDQSSSNSNLPNPDEVRKLEYLDAIFKEVLRYAPVGNLALPHRVTEDDEYRGYSIPKGATVIGNVWALMHDSEVYPDPYTFNPERFIQTLERDNSSTGKYLPQPDPRQFAFGFGKRVCPGSHFAESTILLTMAAILARFKIKKTSLDECPVEFTTGITSLFQYNLFRDN
ncbi:hypothetical protein D9613_008925 [Agrocybe pediades]|uniref:Cytochrome P450 n=1 Tax=Agrocybe pediades TaxID=84607 RepID=A0A8H4QT43_9AGAR|nr:hypothetical protein D9613_008925 [Agrocybe pediades]